MKTGNATGPLILQFAMRGEAAPLLERGEFAPRDWPLPESRYGFELHEGRTRHGHEVLIGIAGVHPLNEVDAIGTLSSGLLAHSLIARFAPRMIINAGTAGGFEAQGGRIGDVYLGAEHVVFHDRRIRLGSPFQLYGEGRRRVQHDSDLAARLGLRTGIVSTGDSLDATPEDLAQMSRLGASVKEMEAAAIATVCEIHGVPLVLLKSITDIVDTDLDADGNATHEQFARNYAFAVERLTERLEQVVAHYS